MLVLAFLMMSASSVLTYMGTAEYGVDASADQEILHYLTQEPAHNKVGIIRTIPFSQLVPGMYSTLQFGADDDNRSVAELNELLNGSQLGMGLRSVLSESYNNIITPDADNFRFRTVPVDAPELAGVLETFYDEMQHEDRELYNGWGILIITENQTDLMRADAIIVWESIELENGMPVLDGEGNVIPVLDDGGGAVHLFSAKHVFVHRDSAYFSN